MVSRLWGKANSWKGKFLSRAGKEVMLKAVLRSIPVYVMSAFKLPDGVIDTIMNFFVVSGGVLLRKRSLFTGELGKSYAYQSQEEDWVSGIFLLLIHPYWLSNAGISFTTPTRWFLMEHKGTTAVESKVWKSIWRCHVPCKIKHFAWRLFKGIIPTKSALCSRNIIPSSLCPVCENAQEDINHCFMDCYWVKLAWQYSGLTVSPILDDGNYDLLWWLNDIVEHKPYDVIEKCLVFIWEMWQSRNARVFKSICYNPADIGRKAIHYLDVYRQTSKASSNVRGTAKLKWDPPLGNVLKLNCDGAFRDDGNAGVGVVILDSSKEVIGAMMSPIQFCLSVKEAETRAILDGLVFAKICGFHRLVVESNVAEIVAEVNRAKPSCSLYGLLIEDIKSLVSEFDVCSFQFAQCNLNRVADRLASLGVYAIMPL